MRESFAISLTLTLLLPTLSGCGFSTPAMPWDKPSVGQKVAEPPMVPAPPLSDTFDIPDTRNLPPDAQPYADVLDLPGGQRATLKAVLAEVMKDRILPIPTTSVPFEPDRAISYGEFTRWNAAFENHRLLGKNADAPSEGQRTALKENLTLHEGITLHPGDPMTREQWAMLYMMLGHKHMPAESKMNAMAPPGVGLDQTFGQFKDYDSISPWARPAVAQAYAEGALQTIFDLSPEQLAIEVGFLPARKLTRGEALIFLHRR